MAKKTGKAKTAKAKTAKAWKPSEYDAINLSALHYFAMLIEQEGMSIYAGDDEKRSKFMALLKDLAQFLDHIRCSYRPFTPGKRGFLEDDCGGPYVRCNDGHCDVLCSPSQF